MRFKKFHKQKLKLLKARTLCIASVMAVSMPAMADINTAITGGGGSANGSYPTFAAAITALNATTLSGPVTVTLTSGQTEALSNAIILTQTGTPSTPITITQSGSGSKPTLTGYTGTSLLNGMFVLNGSDYVTIDGIALNDASSTNATTGMNYGIIMARTSSTNGCQNITIKNCVIKLSDAFATNAIASVKFAYPDMTTEIATTAYSGTNSIITIKSDSIFAASGISFTASVPTNISTPQTAGLRDSGNVVGGSLVSDGNYVYFGSPTITTAQNGISEVWNYDFITQNNIVVTNSGSLTHSSAALACRGIFYNLSSPGSNGLIDNNTIFIRSSAKGASTTFTNTNAITGITCEMSNVYAVGGKVAITNNHISGDVTESVPASGTAIVPFCAIAYDSKADTVLISGNEFSNYTVGSSEATLARGFLGIYPFPTGSSTAQGYLVFKNNTAHDISFGSVAGASSSNYFSIFGLYQYYTGAEVTGNSITNVTRTSGSTSTSNAAFQAGSLSPSPLSLVYSKLIFRNNQVTNFNFGGGTGYGLYFGASTTQNILLNADSNIFNTLSTGGTSSSLLPISLEAINLNAGILTTGSTISHNAFTNLTGASLVNGATGYTLGIYATANGTYDIAYNTISNLIGANTATTYNTSGMLLQGATASNVVNAYNNKITSITNLGAGVGVVNGIATGTAGLSYNFFNNYIADLSAPNYDNTANSSVLSVNGFNLQGGTATSNQVLNNTVIIGENTPISSAGTKFSVSGVYYNNTSPSVNIQNNIFYIGGIPTGTGGYVAAVRCNTSTALLTAGAVPTNLTLKHNILRTNSGINNWLYIQSSTAGTMNNAFSDSTFTSNTTNNIISDPGFNTPCGLFKTYMISNADGTFTENNMALNGDGYYTPTGTSFAEGSAVSITNPNISVDLNGNNRGTSPDMGAIEFNGVAIDMAGPTVSYNTLPNFMNCTSNLSFTATITDASGVNNTAGNKPRLYFKKASDANDENGWKYTEAINTSGNTYTFTFDYSLLAIAPTLIDTIQYFIIAQDLSAGNYTSMNFTSLNACPTSVNLQSENFPASNSKSFGFYNQNTISVAYDTSSVCPGSQKMLIANITRMDTLAVGVASATSLSTGPFTYSLTGGRKTQLLYTAQELLASGLRAGNIQSIAFNVTAGSSVTSSFNVNMGATTATVLTTTFETSPSTNVYSGAYSTVIGINNINFNTPYNWDGVSSILIELCQGNSTSGVTNLTVRTATTSNNRVSYYSSTSTAPCSNTTATATTARPTIIFKGVVTGNNNYGNYTWNDGTANVNINNDTINIVPTFPSGNSMTYTVNINDGYGCSLPIASATLNKLISPIAFTSTTPTNNCGGTATLLNAGTNVTWSPNTGLYTDAGATTNYIGSPSQTVYADMNNNRYVKASATAGSCTFNDSLLVTVPATTNIQIASATSTDSSYIAATSEVHNSACQIMATITPNGASPLNSSVKTIVTLDPSVQNYAGAPYLTRHYEITPNTNGGNATAHITLYYSQAEFNAYNSYVNTNTLSATYPLLPTGSSDAAGIANIKITQYEGVGATPTNNTGAALVNGLNVVWDATLNAWKVTFDVTGFSTFYLHSNITGSPLPIKFVTFNAKAEGNENSLAWTMANDVNGSFTVLHSTNGKTFEPLVTLNANDKSSYSFIHKQPADLEFYNIAYTDAANHVYYSSIQTITRHGENEMMVVLYPNPTKQSTLNVNIMNTSENCRYIITDILGKEVLSNSIQIQTKSMTNATINIDGLPDGIYNFKLISGNTQLVKKLVKVSK